MGLHNKIAKILLQINTKRQEIEKEIFAEACRLVAEAALTERKT